MYNTLKITPNQKILIVAPHPDDETIGCGGILALYGPQCDVLLLTDGRKGTPADGSRTEEETAVVRKKEFETVMSYFHVHGYRELGIPDSMLRDNAKQVSAVDLREYDFIFVPNRNERHPDHAASYEIIVKLHRRQKARAEILEYEVWSPIISANRFVDISKVMDGKAKGVALYASQTTELDYEALARGLNSYRGAPQHVAFCEAFHSELDDRKSRKQRLFAKLPKGIRSVLLCVRNFLRHT